jgi:predicted RNA polymerase sigma factor
VRLLGNFDLAEVMLQEAFIAAAEQWPEQGIPHNTAAWLNNLAHAAHADIIVDLYPHPGRPQNCD